MIRFTNKFLPLGIMMVAIGLSGCLPDNDQPPEIAEVEEGPSTVMPEVAVEENYYRGLFPYEPNQTRGMMYRAEGHGADADRLELGMMEFAQDYFSVEEHLFRQGQLITEGDVEQWLQVESEDNPYGLNPTDAPGRILEHIVEHNYMDEGGDELQGIVLGLSLAATYEVETDEGEHETRYYRSDELRNYAQPIADEVVQHLRNRMQEEDVPIVVALYQQEASDAMTPGNFLSVGHAAGDEQSVSQWETINEVFHLFPSNQARDQHSEVAQGFSDFQSNAQEFYPHQLSVVGYGRFIDDQLIEMSIDVTSEFASITESIQLAQFLGGQGVEQFDENVHLNIYVQSMHEPKAVVVRPANGEVMMHVYR